MKVITRSVILGAAAIGMLAPRAARAGALPNCTSATTMVSFIGYLDCRGAFSGNINGSSSELSALAAFGGLWNQAWTWAGKSDDLNNGPFTGGPTSGPTNTISFDAPISGLFVIGIKQCADYSWYLFNEGSAISSINIDSRGTCDNSGFSHVALYTSDKTGSTLETTTPEPGTTMLLGTGLMAMVGAAQVRRRRKTT